MQHAVQSPSELKNILADENRDQDGVCKHLMKLSSEWKNIHLDGIDYLKKADNTSPAGGIAIVLDPSKIDTEGITRTSTLFCKHGGIIYSVDSGQAELRARENAIRVLDTYLREGVFDKSEVKRALRFLAFVSDVGVPQYGSASGKNYNIYDDYIVGWCEYYREVMGVKISPTYIKAMVYEESRMGLGYDDGVPTTNVTRDVMQSLDIKNYNIYEYIDISLNQFWAKTKYNTYWKIGDIWGLNHTSGELPNESNEDRREMWWNSQNFV